MINSKNSIIEKEVWKLVPGLTTSDGKPSYEISNRGRLRRLLYYGVDKNGISAEGKTFPVATRFDNGIEYLQVRIGLIHTKRINGVQLSSRIFGNDVSI